MQNASVASSAREVEFEQSNAGGMYPNCTIASAYSVRREDRLSRGLHVETEVSFVECVDEVRRISREHYGIQNSGRKYWRGTGGTF